MTAVEIIHMLGGDTAIAEATGWPSRTINAWKPANFIPEWRRTKLIELAILKGLSLSTSDFPSPSERISRRVAA